jgi:dTDP-4-dehydrorhamnose 3,5-epimerase
LNLIKTKISGVYIIKNSPFKDHRGVFSRLFCEKEIGKKTQFKLKQSNLSYNKYKYTLRGFHYQTGKFAEKKILKCVNGKIYDIVVDLRKNSLTYKKYMSVILDSKNNKSLLLPKGCANAFLTMSDDTIVIYYTNNFYNKKFEKGLRFNDSAFKFKWPKIPKVISKKDMNYKEFKN